MQVQEQRHIYYDRHLEIEAYQLNGVVQKFPNHFHDYFVIGFVEGGSRHLWCKGKEYDLSPGDLVIFNPGDNHCCAPINGDILDYRAVNINTEVMVRAVEEICGKMYVPRFSENVLYQSGITKPLSDLYLAIRNQVPKLEGEEALFFLLDQLLGECSHPFGEPCVKTPDNQITVLCAYMEEYFSKNISLDDLVKQTNYGKSYLIRSFTRQTGLSPYRYLQTIRIEKAKKLLQQNVAPIDAANMAGFSDQSHFTNFFKEFIGLTPKQYQRIFIEAPVDAIDERRLKNEGEY